MFCFSHIIRDPNYPVLVSCSMFQPRYCTSWLSFIVNDTSAFGADWSNQDTEKHDADWLHVLANQQTPCAPSELRHYRISPAYRVGCMYATWTRRLGRCSPETDESHVRAMCFGRRIVGATHSAHPSALALGADNWGQQGMGWGPGHT